MLLFHQTALWLAVSPTCRYRQALKRCYLSSSTNRPPPPPDITPIDDSDDGAVSPPPTSFTSKPAFTAKPPSQSQHQQQSKRPSAHPLKRPVRPRRRAEQQQAPQEKSSWMDRNAQFASRQTFRDDFRGTRVFVQGLPPGTSWQTLKDHCRLVGTVVFASVSYNSNHGIVQFETVDEATYAIQALRNHPLDGHVLYARADVQENKENKQLNNNNNSGETSSWQCANPEYEQKTEVMERVHEILQRRDAARRRRNFDAADDMRAQLRQEMGVQIDDRSKLWWVSDEKLPSLSEWNHIATAMDTDVNPEAIMSLLQQRDRARQRRDYATADKLLEQVENAPQKEGLTVRVHDESRTWRLWADYPSKKAREHEEETDESGEEREAAARRECLELVHENDQEHLREVLRLLEQFPALSLLPRLRDRYRRIM